MLVARAVTVFLCALPDRRALDAPRTGLHVLEPRNRGDRRRPRRPAARKPCTRRRPDRIGDLCHHPDDDPDPGADHGMAGPLARPSGEGLAGSDLCIAACDEQNGPGATWNTGAVGHLDLKSSTMFRLADLGNVPKSRDRNGIAIAQATAAITPTAPPSAAIAAADRRRV